MFNEVKQILNYLSDSKIISFQRVYKNINLNIPERDQQSIQKFLEKKGLIENSDDGGGPFGLEEEYNITKEGIEYVREMNEAEDLDKILRYLDSSRGVYHEFENICDFSDVRKSKTLELKLQHSGYFRVVPDKNNNAFGINDEGKKLLAFGGFKQHYVDEIEHCISSMKQSKKAATSAEPLRDRVLKCLYDVYITSEATIDARTVAERIGEDTRTVHRLLQVLAEEKLVIPSDTFRKTGNVSEHIYLYTITQTGIMAVDAKQNKQSSLRDHQADIDKHFPKPSTTVTYIEKQTNFHNKDSVISKQADAIYEAPPAPVVEKKKLTTLEIIGIILTALVSLTLLYEFVLKHWFQTEQ